MKSIADPSIGRSHLFTAFLVFVLAVQSAGGILIPHLYRDSSWVISAFRGTDIVSLAVIIPLLIVMQLLLKQGVLWARLTWMGVLYYVFYNNLYYLFSAYNEFFLVYVAIFILSLSAFIASLVSTNRAEIAVREASKGYRGAISLIMIAIAATIGSTWIVANVNFIFAGRVPQTMIDSGAATDVVAIFDLTLIVPLLIFGAVLLWRSPVRGYVFSAVTIVQFALLTVSLIFTAWVQAAAGVKNAWVLVPILIPMEIACIVAAAMVFRKISYAAPGSKQAG